MKRIITITILFLLISRSLNSFSQDFAFYVHIKDPELIPQIIQEVQSMNVIVQSKNDTLNAILSKYKFKKFQQAFPTSQRQSLREMYMIICNDRKFGDELKEKFHNKIPGVYELEGGPTYTPNDYGLALGQTNLDLVNAKTAWDICIDIPKIGIGVSDTYFDLNHEDLNMTHFGGNNSANVSHAEHGTLVAGCIAAITDNSIGLASVGFNTELFVHSDYGPFGGDNAVLELAQAGHRVINCSWYTTCNFIPEIDTFYQDIRNLYNAVVVFGAGNSRSLHCGNNNPSYPASYESNIAVTSVGHIFNYGTQGNPNSNWKDVHEDIIGDSLSAHKHHSTMDICAPGYNIGTTDIMGSGGINSGNYGNVWGTSYAAPQVSATLGLIFSVNPCLTADEAVGILLNNANTSIYNIPENQRYTGRIGRGRLDVYASVYAAAESATRYLQNQSISGTQNISSNYAIRTVGNVTIPSGANVSFISRKEVTLNGPFEVSIGATFSIDVNVNNVISCN